MLRGGRQERFEVKAIRRDIACSAGCPSHAATMIPTMEQVSSDGSEKRCPQLSTWRLMKSKYQKKAKADKAAYGRHGAMWRRKHRQSAACWHVGAAAERKARYSISKASPGRDRHATLDELLNDTDRPSILVTKAADFHTTPL